MEKERLHNPELIEIGAKRHLPYGRIDKQLTYDIKGNPRLTILEHQEYKLNERPFSSIIPLFSEDYKKFIFPYFSDDRIYLGAEHCDKRSSTKEILQKKCNLTFFGNLEAKLNDDYVIVMASSMGHFHPSKLKIQEIYEFQGYGAMVIDREGENPDLIFIKPGGKVAVPGNCNMTIYNLQLEPLETQDFANPKQNESNKNLQHKKGPIFCIYYIPKERSIHFKINSKYSKYHPSDLSVSVKIPEGEIGEALFSMAKSKSFKKQFASIGVNLLRYNELPNIQGIPKHKKLKEIVQEKLPQFCSLFNLNKN